MASLQAYQSHGIQYYRIVESFRNNGKPAIRVLAHLGRVDDILERHQQPQKEVPVRISSVSAGAVNGEVRLAVAEDRRETSIALRERVVSMVGEETSRPKRSRDLHQTHELTW